MEINKYASYSIVSSIENKKNSENKYVAELIEKFNSIRNFEDAKNYLKTKFNISDAVLNFSLGGNDFLDIKENPKKYSVRITYINKDEKECVIFNYKKERK